MTHRILFVCLGNICRSPLAEGVFRLAASNTGLTATCDSAGTEAWHVGAPPDPRSIATARGRGVDLSSLRARQVTADDFENFDLILAMDRQNLSDLKRLAGPNAAARIALFLSALPGEGTDVPDPYYSGGFEQVCMLIERGCAAWIHKLDPPN